jgi:hypothetical protein
MKKTLTLLLGLAASAFAFNPVLGAPGGPTIIVNPGYDTTYTQDLIHDSLVENGFTPGKLTKDTVQANDVLISNEKTCLVPDSNVEDCNVYVDADTTLVKNNDLVVLSQTKTRGIVRNLTIFRNSDSTLVVTSDMHVILCGGIPADSVQYIELPDPATYPGKEYKIYGAYSAAGTQGTTEFFGSYPPTDPQQAGPITSIPYTTNGGSESVIWMGFDIVSDGAGWVVTSVQIYRIAP